MTNEEKANEIVAEIVEYNPFGDQKPREQATKSAIVMAEWKDRNFNLVMNELLTQLNAENSNRDNESFVKMLANIYYNNDDFTIEL